MSAPKRYILLLLCVITCGLALRLTNFFLMRHNNSIFDRPIVDAQEYVDNARYYLNKSVWGPPGSYFHPPFYSYFVASALLVTGGSLDALRILQILFDVLSILLVFAVGQRIFGMTTGLVAAIFYALFIPSIQYSLEILPPTTAIFLLLVTLYGCLRPLEARRSVAWLAGSALALGLLIINLVNFLLALPVLLAWLGRVRRQTARAAPLRILLLFGLLAMLPAGVVTLRNILHAGETVFVAYNGGINFFIGNNAQMENTVALRPGVEYDRLVMLPYERARIRDFAEQSQYWYRTAWHFIRNRPLAWLAVMLKKAVLFFNARELPRNFDAAFFASYSVLKFLPILRPSLILPLALAALVMLTLERSRADARRPRLLLAGVVGSYALSIILFFVAGRYRLPLAPLYCILAAHFVTGLVGAARNRFRLQARRWLIGAAAALVFGLLTNIRYWPQSYPYAIQPSETASQIGHALTQAGRYRQAHEVFESAEARPADASTYLVHYYHASYHYQSGDTLEAERLFRKTIELKPDHYRAFNDLGFVFKMKGELDSARADLNRSITLAPAFTLAYLNLADCYIAQKDWHRVVGVLESYYLRCPSPSSVISIALGAFYMDVFRDWNKAARHLELAIRYPQGYETAPETYQRLGFCYYYLDDLTRAKSVWSRGSRKFPGYEPLKTNLQMLEY